MALACGGVFNIVPHTIPVQSSTEPIRIVFYGDAHFASDGFCESAFASFKKDYANQDNVYFVDMGDWSDNMRSTHRELLRREEMESAEKILERGSESILNEWADHIDFMKGRILGKIQGNHDLIFKDGRTGTEHLCEIFDCPYLGAETVMPLTFDYKSRRMAIQLDLRHMAGMGVGGTTAGAAVNRRQKSIMRTTCQIHVSGHDHWLGWHQLDPLIDVRNYRGEWKVCESPRFIGGSGGLSRSYLPGKPNYAVERGMSLRPLGNLQVDFHVNWDRNQTELDIRGQAIPRGSRRMIGVAS